MTAQPSEPCAAHRPWAPDPARQNLADYDPDAGGSYQLIADSDTELVLSRPFDIRLPIEAITG